MNRPKIKLVLTITSSILFVCSGILSLVTLHMPDIGYREDSDCWPISASQSTGTIRCWSGGELVYQNSIYHNGGVLCAIDGHEIKITGGKSLCIIESSQDSVWTPPTATEQ